MPTQMIQQETDNDKVNEEAAAEEVEQIEDAEPEHNAAAADVMGAQIAAVEVHCQEEGDEDMHDSDDKQFLIPQFYRRNQLK